MNYKEQGYRDRVAGEKLDDCPYEAGTDAYAKYRAGWRNADDDCGESRRGDKPDLAPGPQEEKVPLHVVISRPQKEQLLVDAQHWGGTVANYVRHRLFRTAA